MMDLYSLTCRECSKLITKSYSTSFSMGIRVFSKEFRDPIYSIYGFVRFADEIVDTFHDFDKRRLLDKFRNDTYQAIEDGISLNPVLHSFQEVVNKYGIERNLIDAFLKSMEMDLYHNNYDESMYQEYIYGSAEVVGLMCLRVFVGGDDISYNHLKESARSLGAAFQKVNFLRDIRSDFDIRSRVYFPGVDFANFTQEQKLAIEADIERDFNHAYEGIVQLPKGCRLGVYVAFVYYKALFNKIRRSCASSILNERIRVPNTKKVFYLLSSTVKEQLGLL